MTAKNICAFTKNLCVGIQMVENYTQAGNTTTSLVISTIPVLGGLFRIATSFGMLILAALIWTVDVLKSAFVYLGKQAGVSAYFLFNLLVIMPLHAFYFETIQGGLPSHEICARITKATEARFWQETAANVQHCQEILDRQFRSFEVTVLMSIYFAFAIMILFRVVFSCVFGFHLPRPKN